MSLSPMMKQYLSHKDENKDAVLLYRVGDFYETFYEDAEIISKELNITLTSRNNGKDGKIPLAGFPCHALDKYITKLVLAGHKVAIGEQTEDPKKTKTLVKRDIVEVITPGTAIDANFLDDTVSNYILSIYFYKERAAIGYADITTGLIYTENLLATKLVGKIAIIKPSEIIVQESLRNDVEMIKLKNNLPFVVSFSYVSDYYFNESQAISLLKEHFRVGSFESFGYEDSDQSLIAASALLKYSKQNKKNELEYINRLIKNDEKVNLSLDYSAIRNLELVEPLFAEDKNSTLLNIIKRTNTSMGVRLLKEWIKNPLIDKSLIDERLNSVEVLVNDFATRDSLTENLKTIVDLERVSSRISYKRVNPKELIALKKSIEVIPHIVDALNRYPEVFGDVISKIPDLFEAHTYIENAINEEPPTMVRDGKIIKDGFNEELDKLKYRVKNSKQWLLDLENKEREKTGIQKLKISYSKPHGYYFEVSKAQSDNVPDYFIRKQTLVNAERYITEELKSEEEFILNSQDLLKNLEYDLFMEVVDKLNDFVLQFQKCATAIAIIDNLNGFAKVAIENNYNKPNIILNGDFKIVDGRHPVIEKIIDDEKFIANDTFLNNNSSQIMIITGPNMAGKSTYLRQNALIAIMAQIGSYVPAKEAHIPIVDKIFTRIGAFDRLSKGQSTFLVEMSEVANILNNATERSLIILDEVGRGTSTFDGLSLAWAIIEYLHNEKGKRAKTMFATHYHELIDMEGRFKNIVNYNVSIKREKDNLIFLRKVKPGGASDSYGIDVANLAGVPYTVIARAKEVLTTIEDHEVVIVKDKKSKKSNESVEEQQGDSGALFNKDDIAKESLIETFKKIQPDNLTPIEALNLLYKLKSDIKKI